jgi:hypothetical protein
MSNGCCVILSPILDIFHKSKEDKKKHTIYDLHTHTHTHTHTCINLYYYYHMIFHFFTFRALLLHWGYFPLDLGIWELEVLEILLALKNIFLGVNFFYISLEWKCWKSLTPKNWRFFMLGLVSMCILHTPQLLNIMWIQNFTIN